MSVCLFVCEPVCFCTCIYLSASAHNYCFSALLFVFVYPSFVPPGVLGPQFVSLFASLSDVSPLLALHCVHGNCLKKTESIAISKLHFLLFSL